MEFSPNKFKRVNQQQWPPERVELNLQNFDRKITVGLKCGEILEGYDSSSIKHACVNREVYFLTVYVYIAFFCSIISLDNALLGIVVNNNVWLLLFFFFLNKKMFIMLGSSFLYSLCLTHLSWESMCWWNSKCG